MRITYIFRVQSKQRSIERVFEPIIENMKADGHDVDVEYAKPGGNVISSLWKNMRYFSKVSKRGLCHITGDVQYVACLMSPNNTILTIHDLVPLHNKSVPWYSKWLCYWFWYYIPLRRLKVVTCISEATRQDIISFFPWAEKKIHVIPNPVDSAFRYVPKVFNSTYPRILHIGTKSNKNLPRVIEALAGLKCHLRIIGKIPEIELLALKNYNIDYSNEEFIDDNQIIQEYIACDIVSFPSLFEGFGMPIIEAQATGRIVVTSNIEPMKTVAGEDAILVDPHDVTSIRQGFIHAISADGLNKSSIIKKGLENARLYNVKSIVQLYSIIYDYLV